MRQQMCSSLLLALILPAAAGAQEIDDAIRSMMGGVNAALAASGANYRVEMAEYLTAGDEVGRTVFFSNVGNKQLSLDFVPGDPRRVDWSGPVGPGDDITWASDTAEGDFGPGFLETQTAISSAMATWDGVRCSELPLSDVTPGGDLGVLQYFFIEIALGIPGFDGLFGGAPDPVADVTQAGFGTIVDLALPPPVIAATFTFQFIDADGNPTDIDNDGRDDAAFREVYYTANFPWSIGGGGGTIDVETVVLHESGHGLSQAHFGKLFRTDSNGKFHFAPRAVMNAGYTGVQREIGKSDNAGHCSNWASWPNR